MLMYHDATIGTLIATSGMQRINLKQTAGGGVETGTVFEMDQLAIVIGMYAGNLNIAQVLTSAGTVGWLELKRVMAVYSLPPVINNRIMALEAPEIHLTTENVRRDGARGTATREMSYVQPAPDRSNSYHDGERGAERRLG